MSSHKFLRRGYQTMAITIEQYKRWQIIFRDMGFYNLLIDGQWGPGSQAAHLKAKQKGIVGDNIFDLPICFSTKVAPDFIIKVKDIAQRLRLNEAGPDQLMACMGWETGETFSPTIRNGAGSSAIGLIQFMSATALALMFTQEQIAKMSPDVKKQKSLEARDRLGTLSAVDQLEYVYQYFKPFTGKVDTLADVYMCILYPVAVGKPDSYVMFKEGTLAYTQNKGIDIDKDGNVTKAECASKVKDKMIRGFQLLK